MSAGVSDGAVIVDTGLNNGEFFKDARQFRTAVNGMTNSVERAGRQMAKGMGNYVRTMQGAHAAAKALSGDQAAIQKEIAKTEARLRSLSEQQELARRKFEAAREAAEEEAARKFQEDTYGAESLPWENELQAAEQLAEDLNAKVREVSESFGEFEDTAKARDLNVNIEYQLEKLEALQAQLDAMKADTGAPVEAATEVTTALEQPVKVAEEELGRYMRLMSDWSATMQEDSWSDAVINDETAMLSITRYINAEILKREEAYHDAIAAIDSAKAAAESEADIHQYISGLIEQREQAYDSEIAQIDAAAGAMERERAATDAVANSESRVSAIGHVLGLAFAGVVSGAGRALVALGKFAGNGAVGFLKKLASGAKNAAIQLARLAANAARGGIKRLGALIGGATRSMLGFNRAQKAANGGMGMSLKNLLRYGLGIRSLFVLFNRLRSAIKDGFAEMAKSNPAVKGAVDSLKASLNGLKGSLATAFAPILTAVAPALSTLVGWLTTAINAIGAFFAALTGKSSYQKAVAGLDSVGGAAGGASGKVKELKRQLAGFDQLEILGDKSSSGGGGGGSGSGGGLTYETEQIGGGIADWVAEIKKLWAAADYDGIGRVIGEGVNSAFAKARELISWDNLGEQITEGVTAITGIFNGLVDAIDWDLIGRTFGDGVNTLLNTANQLLTKIDWTNLGKSFAEGLTGLVDEVDWASIGKLLAARMNAVIETIRGAVSNFSWDYAGTAFARTVNALFSGIEWESLAETATKSINGISAALRTAVNGFKWDYAGEAFARTVNGLFSGINWDNLAATAADSINGVIVTLRTAINGFSWDYAGDAFARTVNRLLSGINWDNLAATAADSINGVIVTLRTAINGFKWDYAGDAFARTVNGLFSGINWDNLAATAADSINGIIVTLRTAINGFSWDYAGDAFTRTVNGLFSGINWDNLGKLAADGIAKPIATLRLAVSGFDWSYAGEAFARSINGFFSNSELWADAAAVVSESIKGLFTWGTELLSDLDAEQIATDIRTFLESVDWDGIAQAIWGFAISATRKIGNLFLALIFGPDYKEKTKKKQEIEDYMSGIITELEGGRDFTVDFGLNWHNFDEKNAIDTLWESIEAALQSGKWVAPIGLDVPPESIEAARQEFIAEWNVSHPEAPIDPALPPDAGTQIQNEWSGQKPRLPAPVHMVKDTQGAQTTEALYSTADKAVTGKVSLGKDGWTTLAAFVGEIGTKAFKLGKDGWTSVAAFVGSIGTKAFKLGKDGWRTIAAFVGNIGTKKFKLGKNGWTSVAAFVGNIGTKKFKLGKDGWTSIEKFITGNDKGETTVKVNLTNGAGGTKWVAMTKAAGGIVTAGGLSRVFASGGMVSAGGRPRWWQSVRKYAAGTARAHGTLFAAGEAGPEIVGHINGRTEILNKSQLAQTMYGAVASGMLYALSRVRLSLPAVATGGAVPYEVAAQVAAAGEALEATLNANNEDLIQTIISVAGQIVAAIQRQERRPAASGGVTAGQVIDEINRRTQMYGVSPLI